MPQKSPVLIYSATGEAHLRECLKPWNPEVLHVDGECINVPVLLESFFRGMRGGSKAYIDLYIRKVEPGLILTFVDNTPAFHYLSARHPHVKTLFVQNGMRAYFGDIFEWLESREPVGDSLQVDFMCVFGRVIGEEYARHVNGRVISIGSLKNNSCKRTGLAVPGSIGFISQFPDCRGLTLNGTYYTTRDFNEKVDRLILAFLKAYAAENNRTLFIIPRLSKVSEESFARERAYFRDILGASCAFSVGLANNSYEMTDRMEVVVSVDSTLGYESAVRGNKTAFFAVRGHMLGLRGFGFGWPRPYTDVGPFWTHLPDPTVFKSIVDHLFAISESQWHSEIRLHGMSDLLIYDPGNIELKSLLVRELCTPIE